MQVSKVLLTKRKSYHHGDLPAALVQAGLRLLESGSVEEFSLREVARDVGVSVGAIYRHFPDKTAMLRTLAQIGMESLGQAQQEAAQKAGNTLSAFSASGRAYVRFALARPSLFRVMMSYSMISDATQMSTASPSLPMRFLMESVAKLMPNAGQAEARVMAMRAWAEVHGLSMLMLEKQIPQDDALIDTVIDAQTYDWAKRFN